MAFAALELEDTKPQAISDAAAQILEDIQQLPQAHFFSNDEQYEVDLLLSHVLDEQNKHIKQFKKALADYRQDKGDRESWDSVELSYHSLLSLSQSKEKLLTLSSDDVRELVVGFGPDGVIQFTSELTLTRLNLQYFIYQEIRGFKHFISDIFISPIPVLIVFFKVFFVFIILRWWLKNSDRLLKMLREKMNRNNMKVNIFVRLFWYLSRAQRAIAWLIAITLSLRITAELPTLQHLLFIEIFTWWILGGSIAISFILEFAYQHSHQLPKDLIRLRLSTIRLYVWGFIITGLIAQISAMTLGKGTIYAWISTLITFFYIVITIVSLHKWKTFIFSCLNDKNSQPILVRWAVQNRARFLFGTLCTVIVALWLVGRNLQHGLINMLSHYQIVSHAMAYLFRIEVAKQTDNDVSFVDLERVPDEQTFDYVRPGRADSELIEAYASQELKQVARYVHNDQPAVCVVSGERGVGTTTFLRRLLHDVTNATPLYVDCTHEGYQEVLALLANKLEITGEVSEKNILSFLQDSDECYLIAFDNVQRLIKPQVGGLIELMSLTNLMRRTLKNHRIIFAIEKASWRFVDRARGERLLFDLVTFMPRWSEVEIRELLKTRTSDDGDFALSFDGLALPRQWDNDELSAEERVRNGFYRILWDFSDGNATVALRFFRRSLFRNTKTGKVVVRIFKIPSSKRLEQMPKPMLAVLRSIVQLEIASAEELSECTRLSINEVISTLRYFQSLGYIEWRDDKSKVSDLWYRNITNILHRQHLLVK